MLEMVDVFHFFSKTIMFVKQKCMNNYYFTDLRKKVGVFNGLERFLMANFIYTAPYDINF